MKSVFILATTLLSATGGHVLASSSDWVEMEGARVRLVTAGEADAEGRLKGVLDIDLKPGWKTYWRDPGDAGVPPTIEVLANPNLVGAALDFPAPQRHDDGAFQWAGYDYPVAFPVTFTLKDANGPSAIEADVFLGVCETICVPVQAKFRLNPGDDPDTPADHAAVTAAFAAVPYPATTEFGVKVAGKQTDKVLLEASVPGDPESAELFVAGEDGYVFTTPVRETRDGKAFFSFEVIRPDDAPTGPGIRYTLVNGSEAVNGVLPYF